MMMKNVSVLKLSLIHICGVWSCFGACKVRGADVIKMHQMKFHLNTREEAEESLRSLYKCPKREETVSYTHLSKLIPAMNVDDIMRRIGDGWTDSNLGGMIDDACITIMQQIEAKESQCLNYWLTDDKDVYYLSFVFNGNESADSALSYKIYNLCKRRCV